jgi:protein-S-isoprenylcysteine O-methyltransferase Ste14
MQKTSVCKSMSPYPAVVRELSFREFSIVVLADGCVGAFPFYPTVIVRTGPYSFSRNPIYLAFSLFQLGIAIWVNSVWLVATLVGAVALVHFVVIPREEQYMERKFGPQYLAYKASVGRWL